MLCAFAGHAEAEKMLNDCVAITQLWSLPYCNMHFKNCLSFLNSEMDVTLAGLLLPHCMRESSMFCTQESTTVTPYPHVMYSGDEDIFGSATEFRVFADGVHITCCRDVCSALTTCFVLYWIFDIAYSKSYIGALTFLDNFVFRKKNARMLSKVATFLNHF